MKLSQYAKKLGISYITAWRWFKQGKIKNAFQAPSGTIIVMEEQANNQTSNLVAIYARVSSHENRSNLESQVERLKLYANAHGYIIRHVVKEVGSGVNDNRRKLIDLLNKKDYNILLVEHKDRLTRFGFNYIKLLMQAQHKRIEIVNESDDEKENLIEDLVSIIYSFCAKLYGLRRAKRKTERIIKELKEC